MAPTSGLPAAQRRDLVAYLEALPFGVVDDEVPLDRPLRPAGGEGWQADGAVKRHDDLRVHPGRYLAAPPVEIAFDDIATLELPAKTLVREGIPYVWAGLRDRGGALRGANDSAVLSFTSLEVEAGAVVPRVLASAHGGDGIEVASCRIHPQRYGYGWRGDPLHSVMCAPQGHRQPAAALGSFGLAVRTSLEGKPALLVMGPDAFPDLAGNALNIGALERTYSDSYLVPLAAGQHAEIVRLDDYDHFWPDSAFALEPKPGLLSISWPQGAAQPRILTAEITRARLDG